MIDATFMRIALERAHRSLLAGEAPIGACVVRDGEVIARAGNSIIATLDITAHAEMQAIRAACGESRTLDLSGCTLYSTVEPCAMCLAASNYAGIDTIVYAAGIDDLHRCTGQEFAAPSNLADSLNLHAGCLRDESVALLQAWARQRHGRIAS